MQFHRFGLYAALTSGACVFAVSVLNAQEAETAVAVPVAPAAAPALATPAEKVEARTRPLNVRADLNVGVSITGTLTEADVLVMKTAFGEAQIPLSEVAGIRFASGEDVTTTVVMINGDSITGATDVKSITIDTDWGSAKINGSAIQSLMLVPNLKWISNSGISGKRWSLVDEKAAPSATQNAPAMAPVGSNVLPSGNLRNPQSNRGVIINPQ